MQETSKDVIRAMRAEKFAKFGAAVKSIIELPKNILKSRRTKVIGAVAVAPLVLLSTCDRSEYKPGDNIDDLAAIINESDLTPLTIGTDGESVTLDAAILDELYRVQEENRLVPPSQFGHIRKGDKTWKALAQSQITEPSTADLPEVCYTEKYILCIEKNEAAHADEAANGTLYEMKNGLMMGEEDVLIGTKVQIDADGTIYTIDESGMLQRFIDGGGGVKSYVMPFGEADTGDRIFYSPEFDEDTLEADNFENGVALDSYYGAEQVFENVTVALGTLEKDEVQVAFSEKQD